MGSISVSSLGGFITGFGLILILIVYQWRKGTKERRFDERYETVHSKARNLSWGITVILTFLLLLGAAIYEGPKLAFILLTIIYAVLLLSYWGAVIIFNKRT